MQNKLYILLYPQIYRESRPKYFTELIDYGSVHKYLGSGHFIVIVHIIVDYLKLHKQSQCFWILIILKYLRLQILFN